MFILFNVWRVLVSVACSAWYSNLVHVVEAVTVCVIKLVL